MISCTLSKTGVPDKDVEKQHPNKIIDEVEFTLIVSPIDSSNETVNMELHIENKSAKVKRLTFNSAQKYDFHIINSDGEEVWRWSRGKSFIQIMEDIQVPAGVKIAFIEKTSVKDLSSGIYTVNGKVMTSPESVSLKDQLEIKK